MALDAGSVLGEGLLWQPLTQTWWWTDIESNTLSNWSAVTGRLQVLRMPDRVGSFVFTRSGGLIVGLAKRIGWIRAEQLQVPANLSAPLQVSVHTLCAVDAAEPRTRINDGRTDRSGNYVFGTMNQAEDKRPIGSFYQYSARHGLRRLALPAVAIANSICFSPDGRTMYFCDTLQRCIMQCDYDSARAQVGRLRRFAQPHQADAYPDGSVVDQHGHLWNAEWGAGSVACYGPNGQLLERYAVPAKNPTCPAIGGSDYSELMVTSARLEMDEADWQRYPHAGGLFHAEIQQVQGMQDCLFDDTI